MYDTLNGIPQVVLNVLTPLRKKYDFLYLENSEALFYELRSKGHEEVVKFISNEKGDFDRHKFESVVLQMMKQLRKDRI